MTSKLGTETTHVFGNSEGPLSATGFPSFELAMGFPSSELAVFFMDFGQYGNIDAILIYLERGEAI